MIDKYAKIAPLFQMKLRGATVVRNTIGVAQLPYTKICPCNNITVNPLDNLHGRERYDSLNFISSTSACEERLQNIHLQHRHTNDPEAL